MLERHEAHLDRLEYELGLFTSSAFHTDPPELKEHLAEPVRKALQGEREIVQLLAQLKGTSSSIGDEDTPSKDL